MVGSLGWVTVKLGPGEPPPHDHFKRWIDKSYRVVVDNKPAVKKKIASRRS
jgi:hypothetical protein